MSPINNFESKMRTLLGFFQRRKLNTTNAVLISDTSGMMQEQVIGTPNTVATLDSEGKVPTEQMPYMGGNFEGYYDRESDTFYTDSEKTKAITPMQGSMYVDLTNSNMYRFDGEHFVQISDLFDTIDGGEY